MAKAEEVFIHLQVLGAGESRRDIDNVARALDRLDKKTGQHTNTLKENTKAQGASNAQTARANQLNDSRAGTMTRVNRVHRDFNKLLKSHETLEKSLTKTQDVYIKGLGRRERAMGDFDRVSNAMSKREIIRATSTERQLSKITEKGWKNQENLAKKYQKRINRGSGGGGRRGFGGGGGGGGHLLRRGALRVGAMGVLIGTAIEGIPLLATGLNALGAAGLAAANGLAPLIGILGALPAGLLAMGSLGAVIAMATTGLGKAIGGDAKAMAELGPNAQAFVQSLIDSKGPMRELKKEVQETFLNGLGFEIRNLVVNYLPALHKHLKTVAQDINTAGKETLAWFSTSDGSGVMNNIFSNNENIIARWAVSGTQLLQLFLRLGSAAGPMLTAMSEDFMNFISGLNGAAAGNPRGLENFFTGSYERLKQVIGVLGDFGMGIYNIVKLADPLTSFLGDWITDLASGFREWTESAGGQDSITKYFEDMREPMRAIIDLAGKLAGGLFAISQSDNFVKFMDKLSGDGGLIDGLVNIFKNADTTFLDAWIVFFEAIETFAAEGGLKMLGDIALGIANAVKMMVDAWASLPSDLQKVVLGLVVAGAVVSKVPGAGGALGGAIGLGGRAGAGGAAAGGKMAGFGPAALLAPVALAGIGASIYEQNRTKGFGLEQGKINDAVARGSLGSLFGSNTGPVGGKMIGPDGSANSLNRFGDNKGLTAQINDLVEKSFLGSIWSTLTGAKTSWDIEKEKWVGVDTALANLPLDQAATRFKDVADEAKRLGVPADILVNELFPQFRDRLYELDPGMRTVGLSAEDMATRMGGANTILLTALASLQNANFAIGPQLGSGTGLTSGGPEVINPYFAGGLAGAGQLALAGEMGPELAFTRGGGMGILGLNGPELFRPGSDLGILPNSALHGGGTGNAPDWAVKALNGGGLGSDNAARIAAAQSKQNATDQRPINIDVRVNNPSSNVDVTRAVVDAVREIEKDKRERK